MGILWHHVTLFPGHMTSDKDAAVVREQLEKDLHSTKAALKERKQTDGGEGPPLVADTQDHRPSPEVEVS